MIKMFSNQNFMAYEQQKITSRDQNVLTNATISQILVDFILVYHCGRSEIKIPTKYLTLL
jgi:hypothetical protein